MIVLVIKSHDKYQSIILIGLAHADMASSGNRSVLDHKTDLFPELAISAFLDILQLFYSLHYTSFPFLKGCRLEKGHIVPVLCSHS